MRLVVCRSAAHLPDTGSTTVEQVLYDGIEDSEVAAYDVYQLDPVFFMFFSVTASESLIRMGLCKHIGCW